jgi:hypothetical protein
MPAPMKPCDGSFSDKTHRLLLTNVHRAQWLLHACARCGQHIHARLENGPWLPDVNWLSIPQRAVARSTVGGLQFTKGERNQRKPGA